MPLIKFCPGTFLSTLSLRRATQPRKTDTPGAIISIHALLAESDGGFGVGSWPRGIFLSTLSLRRATTLICEVIALITISIHALLAESDHQANAGGDKSGKFLSTLSLRRATLANKTPFEKFEDFYPRSPCGERPDIRPLNLSSMAISIHALLAESDARPAATSCK